MSGYLLQVGFGAQCPHGGPVQASAPSARVKLSQQPAVLIKDQSLVSGCSFVVGTKPQPCVGVTWLVASQRVRIEGQQVLLNTSSGLCRSADQIPQGAPIINSSQSKVRGE